MKIKDILSAVENFEAVMPEFQREYVWSLELAKQLFVSLYKNYPTGSLLLWEAKGEDVPEIKNNAVKKEKLGFTKVILDGQQRLTTLYLIMKGKIPPYYTESDLLQDPRHLYFNLETNEFNYFMKTKMEGNPTWQKVADCFDLEKVDALDVAEQYCKIHAEKDYRSFSRVVNNNLTRLRQITEMDYPIQTVPSTAKIDEAIDVFDRVNSKGTKLTDAELVLTHITGKWPKARRKIKEKIELVKKENFEFDLDFFTRCLVVTLTDSALFDRNAKLNYELFTQEDYIAAWNKVSKTIDYIIPILKQDALIGGSKDMTTHNVIVPLVAYLLKHENRFAENIKYGFIYWLLLGIMWSRYSGQTDSRLDKDVYLAISKDDPIEDLVNEIKDQRGRIEVKAADLEGREAGNPMYKLLYLITKNNKAIDWSNGSYIYGTVGDSYSIQSHHIFPQSVLYNSGYDSENHLDKKKVNEIANRAFITRDTNYAIQNTAPENYLPIIESKYPGALQKQYIPLDDSLWKISNYEKFLEVRRNNIATEINSFLQNFKNKHLLQYHKQVENDWGATINQGENNFVEFKSTLRWDIKLNQVNKALEGVIAKTIAAFMNTEGGRLFIGVDDSGVVLGLADDYKSLGSKPSRDGFLLKLNEIINNYLGREFHQYINSKIEKIKDKDVCIISITSSDMPVYCKLNGEIKFFIRAQAASEPLGTKETVDYITSHWNGKNQ